MAAATQDTVTSKIKDAFRIIAAFVRNYINNDSPQGILIPVNDKATVPTTAIDDVGDILRISPKFPSSTYVWQFRGTPSDMDAGTALVYDVVYVDESDSVVATFASGSTKAQAASGSDVLADGVKGKFLGVGYVALKTTTAATTPAAGTYKWSGLFSLGTLFPSRAMSGAYLKDGEA